MLNGAFALLERSLRVDARAWSPHLMRLGLVGAIYCSLCFALATRNKFGAPGLRFLQGIAYLDATFMTLLGLAFFSTVITEEKEEDTLGLMLMAGISPLGILAGKTGGRLWQAMLLIAVQYPLTLLAVTMGGISPSQIMAASIALMAYMVFLAGFGLLCSTLASNSRQAGTAMCIGLGFYLIAPWTAKEICSWISDSGQRSPTTEFFYTFISFVGEISVFFQLSEILVTGFADSPWSAQVVVNSVLGLVSAALSWLLFDIATRSPATELVTRGFVARQRAFFRFSPGRPRINPFIWKDFHFVSGGIGMILLRVGYYGVMAVPIYYDDALSGSSSNNSWVGICLLWMSFSVAVDAGVVLARSMQDELRSQTFSSLLMLPHSTIGMIYCKFAGAMIGWLPGPIIELLFTLSTQTGRADIWDFFFVFHGSLALILLFMLIPHFAALISVYVRWGAVPIAIGLTIGVYFLIVAAIQISQAMGSNNPEDVVFFSLVAFVEFCICVGCHIGVLLRVQALGAR